MKLFIKVLLISTTALLFTACGGGSSSENNADNSHYTLSSIEYENVNYVLNTPHIGEGEKIQLLANGVDHDSNPVDLTEMVKWKSLDTNIASISDHGLLTAVSVGTTTIMAELDDSSVELSVDIKSSYFYKIIITPSDKTINVGDTFTFSAKRVWTDGHVEFGEWHLCQPAYLFYGRWYSSNKNIASIDCNGTAVGISKGTVTIGAFWSGDQPDIPSPRPVKATLTVK